MNKRPENAQRPGRNGALAADTVAEATTVDNSIIAPNAPSCQPPNAEDLKRKIAYHRQRAAKFARLAQAAWRLGDTNNRRKMQRAQWAEVRLADAAHRVLLGLGETS